MKKIINGKSYDCFAKGEYIVSDDGNQYCFLTDVNINTKSEENNDAIYTAKAFDETRQRNCFLKFAPYDNENQANWLTNNLYRESQFRFYYPYIEHVYEGFSGTNPHGERVYCVSVEFVDGWDIRNYAKEKKRMLDAGEKTETELEEQMFRNMMQFLYGVNYYINYAKEAYLHRDLKPENVMITPKGDVVIIDFDYAHISQSQNTINLKNWGLALSNGFTDPRTVNNENNETDKMSDIYSIGRLFFYWLNEKQYFKEENGELDKTSLKYYCKDLKVGFGTEDSRFKEKYQGKKYQKLREIIRKMCADPSKGERYTEIVDCIRDMKLFLLSYCNNSPKEVDRLLQIENMPILQKRESRDNKYVKYKVFPPGKGKRGITLYENAMYDMEIDGQFFMTIYNLDGVVYYIPPFGKNKVVRQREDEDFEIHSNDIFEIKDYKIEFYI